MTKPTKKQIAESQKKMAEFRRKQEVSAWFAMVQLINEKLLDSVPFYLEQSYGMDESLHLWIEGYGDDCIEIEGESAIDFIRGGLAMREVNE